MKYYHDYYNHGTIHTFTVVIDVILPVNVFCTITKTITPSPCPHSPYQTEPHSRYLYSTYPLSIRCICHPGAGDRRAGSVAYDQLNFANQRSRQQQRQQQRQRQRTVTVAITVTTAGDEFINE